MSTASSQPPANRDHASPSTGPRTPPGKDAARLNAVTHGIFAADLVASAASAGESPDDFTAFLTDLTDAYQPWGPLEIILVNRIANLCWRLQRVTRAESGEIAHALLTASHNLRRQRRDNAVREYDSLRAYTTLEPHYRYPLVLKTMQTLAASADGLAILRKRFTAARDHLIAHQTLTASLVRFLHVASPSAAFTRLLPPFPSVDDEPDTAPCRVPSRPALLDALDQAVELLGRDIDALGQRERAQDDALLRSLALPAAPAADKLLRYEKSLAGQLARATHELHRLQSQRLRRDEF